MISEAERWREVQRDAEEKKEMVQVEKALKGMRSIRILYVLDCQKPDRTVSRLHPESQKVLPFSLTAESNFQRDGGEKDTEREREAGRERERGRQGERERDGGRERGQRIKHFHVSCN